MLEKFKKIRDIIFRNISTIPLSGNNYYCPLCDRSYRKFLPAGVSKRPHAMCPGCGSLERHRLLWVTLQFLWNRRQIKFGGKMLHIAPEPALAEKFKQDFIYLSADLDGNIAMIGMDITEIGYPDNSFDSIVCNHVLEHIMDDHKALSELFRVLKPGGWGSIQVPMKGEITQQEELFITDPEERKRLYGQSDHVRQYGNDFVNKLRKVGFDVLVFEKSEILNLSEQERISIACENKVLIVLK